MRISWFVGAGVVLVAGVALVADALPAALAQQQQQMPLAPARASGQTVTPAYEGWYENPDGTFTLSFGYYNRNTEEIVDIPLGEDNFIEPAQFDGDQPTHFLPRRHWGVFGVEVPANFDGRVVWTLNVRGETFSIPGHLEPEWQIDALAGEAGAGNTPPVLKLGPSGPEGAGPGGIRGGKIADAKVGQPTEITVWAADDGRPDTSIASGGRRDVPVTLTWLKHQGPGDVTFGEESGEVPVEGGSMTNTATFSAPGEYVLRVRANDASGVSGAGHAQCCWSNAFIKVIVTS